MRALKALVIVMTVLLVGGTAALIAGLVWRATHHAATRQAATAPPPAAARPFTAALDLPAGASVREMRATGERLVLRIALADGGERLVVLDLGSGARLGTIELRAAR